MRIGIRMGGGGNGSLRGEVIGGIGIGMEGRMSGSMIGIKIEGKLGCLSVFRVLGRSLCRL